jgi:hypothetical protein
MIETINSFCSLFRVVVSPKQRSKDPKDSQQHVSSLALPLLDRWNFEKRVGPSFGIYTASQDCRQDVESRRTIIPPANIAIYQVNKHPVSIMPGIKAINKRLQYGPHVLLLFLTVFTIFILLQV